MLSEIRVLYGDSNKYRYGIYGSLRPVSNIVVVLNLQGNVTGSLVCMTVALYIYVYEILLIK